MRVPFSKAFRVAADVAARNKKRTAVVLFFVSLSAVLSASAPLFLRYAFNQLTDEVVPNGDDFFLVLALGLLSVGVLSKFSEFLSDFKVTLIEVGEVNRLRARIFNSILHSSAQSRTQFERAVLIERVGESAENVEGSSLQPFSDVFGFLLTAGLAILMGVLIDWELALMAFCLVAVCVAIALWQARNHRTVIAAYKRRKTKYVSFLTDTILGIRDLQAVGRQRECQHQHKEEIEDLFQFTKRRRWVVGAFRPTVRITFVLIEVMVLFVGWQRISESDQLKVGDLIAMVGYLEILYMPILYFVLQAPRMEAGLFDRERIANASSRLGTSYPQPHGANSREASNEPFLALEGLAFGYGSASATPLFRDVSLCLQKGELVAIVGPNGHGKTTLLSLVSGALHPRKGQLRFKGVNLTHLPPWERRQIVIAHQDPYLFKGTLYDNLLPPQNVSRDMLLEKLSDLGLLTPFSRFENGIDTKVSQGRRSLSAGELKMLGLARAIAQGQDILLVDEPTESLHPQLRKIVYQCMKKIRGHTTVLCATHDGDLISLMDRTAVLEAGELRVE